MSPFKIYLSVAVFICVNLPAFSQISPGELSKAHAELEGMSNCMKCHSAGNNIPSSEKCMACHTEIRDNIKARKGYHGSSEVMNKECFSCHTEHQGRNFRIIRFDKKKFDHRKTGFALQGEHAKQECAACHNPKRISNPDFRNKPGTFMGLKKECLACHDDYHQGKLSSNCTDCHGFDTFKKATGFDHSKTRFPLLGKHKNVECIRCHKTEIINKKTVQKFSGLAFDNCTACHKDVHNNKFGQNCKKCHTEESFHFNKGMKAFDHDKTAFKLLGKHKLVDCRECHKTSMTAPLKHDYCNDCHKDYHNGDFNRKGISPDCNECHTNQGFTPSTFTVQKHNQTKFKLENAHLATECTACHKKQEGWTFRKMGKNCVDCHQNVHKGIMEEKFIPEQKCTLCHNTTNWKSVTFDHSKTGFKLEGTHAKTQCAECHYRRNEAGKRIQMFAGTPKDCSACHAEPHRGQFEVNGKTECLRCHNNDNWHKSTFNHNNSRFKLEGGHEGLKCDECHKPVNDTRGKYIQYKFDDISCSRCHA